VGEAATPQTAYNGLAKRIKDDMVHHNKLNMYPVSENSYKLLTHDTGNDAVKFPTKLKHPDLLETSPNKNPTPTSQTTNLAKALHIQSRRTPVLAQPRNKGSTTEWNHSLSVF